MKLASLRQRQGAYFEQLACDYLQAHGLTLVARNWHCANLGELDLVMLDNRLCRPVLVIIEVRQRKPSRFGQAGDTISRSKQKKLIATTEAFLQAHPQFADAEVRFDVVTFDQPAVIGTDQHNLHHPPDWLTAAFIAEA